MNEACMNTFSMINFHYKRKTKSTSNSYMEEVK